MADHIIIGIFYINVFIIFILLFNFYEIFIMLYNDCIFYISFDIYFHYYFHYFILYQYLLISSHFCDNLFPVYDLY
jgi:hypothetical protein